MFKALKRLVYHVDDLQKAKEWYSKVLGDDPAFDSPVACVFRIGSCSLSLSKAAAPQRPGGSQRIAAYWEVANVDDAFRRLTELGATPKTPPTNVLSVRAAEIVDPFGNVVGLTGEIPHDRERTIENQASETAHVVALCRALISRDDRDGIRRADPFSEEFVKPEARAPLEDEAKRRLLIDARISRPLYGFFIARTGFVDDVFVRALRSQTPQIVLLGAGYDTRALRFEAELANARVFELDAPSTQGRKLSVLRSRKIAVPRQVSFIAVNFKTADWPDRLRDSGFDPSLRTLFVWEGVTYYLPQEAVGTTLELARAHSGPGSSIVFDYMTHKLDSVSAGEPFLSWQDPAALPSYLERHGFSVVDHLDAAAMVQRYLTLADGEVVEKPLPKIRLVYAERSA